MKKVISFALSLVMIVCSVICVDLSAYASNKPEYTTFQAQIYASENCGFDNIFAGTDSSSFARTLYNDLSNDALFVTGVETWEGLHIATSPSYSLESGLITKKDFYEVILFDMLDASDEGALTSTFGDTYSKLFKMIKNERNSFVISTAKKIMDKDDITVDELKTFKYIDMSDESKKLLLEGTKYANDISLISEVNKLLGYAKSIYDAIDATANYLALKECQKGTQEILEFIYNDKKNDYALRLAAECVSTCYNNSYDRVMMSLCEGGFSAIETSFGMIADYAWSELVSIIPGGTAVLLGAKGARALCNYLFSTDKLTKGYYQLEACVDIEDALIRALQSNKNSIDQNPQENAEIYMQGISMYKDIILLGFDYSIDLLETSANSEFNTSTDFWLGDYSECVSLINQIETFKNNKINNFIRYEEIVSNKFKELYYPDYNDIESQLNSNTVPATSMSVKQIKTINLGDSGSIYDFFSFTYGPDGFTTLTWEDGVTSSNQNIIKVETTNYSGDKITAVSEGSCTLTFSSNSGALTDSIEVTVGNGSSSGNHDYYSDWEYTVNSDGTTATITKYKGSPTTVYIPSKLNNYEVSRIGSYVFSDQINIKRIIIPNSIVSIESCAFDGCTNLTSITIPNSVTDIGGYAFSNCNSLTSITIPNGVVAIEEGLLSRCTSLTNVTIPNSVVSIDKDAFYGCTNLTTIAIPRSVQTIIDPFSSCTSLLEITLPVSLEYVDSYTWDNPCNIKKINLILGENNNGLFGKGVSSRTGVDLDGLWYMSRENIEVVTLEDGIKEIPDFCFYECANLTSVVLPKSVEIIGMHAFSSCYNIYSINIPNNVAKIGYAAFSNCNSLTSITIPNKVESLDVWTFSNCSSLEDVTIPVSCNINDKDCFEGTYPKKITYTSGFNENSFNNGNLEGINGTMRVTNIPWDYAHPDCIEEVIIEEGVINIGDRIFSNCSNLSKVSLPNTVEVIGDYAFQGCTSLTNISLPENLSTIGEYSFSSSGLKSIELPKNVNKYGSGVFYNCKSLEKVVFNGIVENLNSVVYNNGDFYSNYNGYFENCEQLNNISIKKGLKNIGAKCFYNCINLENICNLDAIEYVGQDAFEGTKWFEKQLGEIIYVGKALYKTNILTDKNIKVKDGTISITGSAFYNENIENIELPNSLNFIGAGAFLWTELKNVTIPSSVTYIGDQAFNQIYTLESINVDNKNLYYSSKDGVLYNNEQTVIIQYPSGKNEGCYRIPNSVKTIQSNSITTKYSMAIEIPKTVKKIEESSFYTPSGSQHYFYNGTEDEWNNIDIGYNMNLETSNIHYKTTVNNGTNIDITEATCNDYGTMNVKCLLCKWEKKEYISPLGHTKEFVKTIDPIDCYNPGYSVYKCSKCGEEYYDDYVYIDHQYEMTTIEPTCTEGGYDKYQCSACGDYYTANWTESLGHTVEKIETIVPTCVNRGYTKYHCTRCDDEYTNDYLNALGHIFVDGVCQNCGMLEEDCIESSHPYGNDYDNTWTINKPDAKRIALTFSKDTETESCDYIYLYDSDNNEIGRYSGTELASKRIIIKGDTVKIRLVTDGSVTYYGFALSNVQTYYEDCNHDSETEIKNARTATCSSKGYSGDTYCVECGEIISKGRELPIDVNNHDMQERVVAPTCTAQGYTEYYCWDCNYSYKTDYISATGIHTYVNGFCQDCKAKEPDFVLPIINPSESQTVEIKNGGDYYYVIFTPKSNGTCTFFSTGNYDTYGYLYDENMNELISNDDGGENYNFSINYDLQVGRTYILACRMLDSDDTGTFDVTLKFETEEHVHSYDSKTVKPTCTKKGYTTYTCECGDSYVDNYVNATGHNWNGGVITEYPSCTAAGVSTYTCTACGVTKTETIAKTSHRVVTDGAVSPTCTETGLTGGSHCSVCGKVIVSQTVIPALGHTPVTDKAVSASCTKTGKTAGSHCSVCGLVINPQKTVAKKAHTYKTYTTKATISKNGSVVTKCTVCGVVKSKSTIYYPKTIKLSKTSYTYNGKVQTPSVTVKDSKGKTLKKNTDYTVTYAKGRKNVGKYAVKITFKGKYSGSKTLYYTIKPKSTSISKVTAGKKKLTVKWKKLTAQTTGYQIQYSTNKNFKSAKTVTVSKNKTTSKTISKLKAKKKYYVRIRTYKTVGKAKYYSSWSKAKAVTTKK